ncbi:hypothetical protein NBO_2g0086 [Nosema bombycis CQ1]|uniref:Uncharacterized protein n=1 Tax=Nosema bombycis (strain CQ1 / CVCC 102059) TaxID=578461 RepID=R0MMX7_NOSB1|nr:hypothetical protein NBO_2g0086 [Nosema bombycis CQ1]|eukprot:EOB15595.1 hypothetical protein NBO_2g0086 [Nosema bombycis CQ1]
MCNCILMIDKTFKYFFLFINLQNFKCKNMGENIYSLDKAMDKKKTSSQDVSEDILQEAQQVEEENYQTAKDIRMQIGSAAIEQKGATEEMRRQGETLDAAKRAAVGVHREARRGDVLADDIEREGHFFNFRCACLEKLFGWFRKDPNDEKVEEIANKEVKSMGDSSYEREDFVPAEKEMVPGQNKTDKELNEILNTVKGIRSEAELQGEEAQRQKTVVKDISAVNEQAEKVIKRTDTKLKKL